MNKKELVSEFKRQVKRNLERKFDLSGKAEDIEMFTEVGKRNCYGEGD